ncbi:MAG TPA: hypothetical protein VGL51_12325 [Solirubrobacteraceae bacterium]|jgi:hypothetical protein
MIASARRSLSAFFATATLLAAGAVVPVAAQADFGNAQSCSSGQTSQPFAQWGDSSSYALVSGGDFESSGWTLTRNAARVAGSEPFAATGSLGQSSLSLPAGSSATSPATCVDAGYPTMRFFISGSGTALVQVVYNGSAIPVGFVAAGGDWAPSPVVRTGSALFSVLGGGSAQVSLRLTALTGDPQIDDVFIDPWNRG